MIHPGIWSDSLSVGVVLVQCMMQQEPTDLLCNGMYNFFLLSVYDSL